MVSDSVSRYDIKFNSRYRVLKPFRLYETTIVRDGASDYEQFLPGEIVEIFCWNTISYLRHEGASRLHVVEESDLGYLLASRGTSPDDIEALAYVSGEDHMRFWRSRPKFG